MKHILITTVALLFCLIQTGRSQQAIATENCASRCSIESAAAFLQMAQRAMQGTQPAEADWQKLFATEGYQRLFEVMGDKWKGYIRQAFPVAFDPTRQAALDSLSAKPAQGWSVEEFMMHNFASMKPHIDELEALLTQSHFDELFRRADARVREFLPEKYRQATPRYKDFHFVCMDPESRTMEGDIFMDVYSFFYEGEQGMVNLLAHEMHHTFWDLPYAEKYRETDDAVIRTLRRMQVEGMADMINKITMPTDRLGAYGPEFVEMYNQAYADTPEALQVLDEMVQGYLDKQVPQDIYDAATEVALYGGHTGGDYMVFLIRDRLGMEAAVNMCGDIVAFVKLYNEAARQAGTYVLSDRFVNHVEKVMEGLRKDKDKNGSSGK